MFVSIQRGSYKSRVHERGLYRSTIADSCQCEIVSRIRFRVHHALLCPNIAELDNNEDIVCTYVCMCRIGYYLNWFLYCARGILRGDIASAFRKRERRDVKLINPNLCVTCENRVNVLFQMCQMTFLSRLIRRTSQLSEILWWSSLMSYLESEISGY